MKPLAYLLALLPASLWAAALAVQPVFADEAGNFSAPFGLEWGMTKDEVAHLSPIDIPFWGMYTRKTLSPESFMKSCRKFENKNHFSICKVKYLSKNLLHAEHYNLVFNYRYGLIRVTYVSEEVDKDTAKSHFEDINSTLVTKYGEAFKNNRLEFMRKRHLLHQKLSWNSLWKKEIGDETASIFLELKDINFSSKRYVQLQYTSSLFDKSQNEEDMYEYYAL